MLILAFLTTLSLVTITDDPGGAVLEYYLLNEHYKKAHTAIAIKGTCGSSCTMFLETACVYPSAKLMFHGASTKSHRPIEEEIATKIIADHYPPKLKEWFYKHAAHLRGKQYKILSGAEVIRLGVKECVGSSDGRARD